MSSLSAAFSLNPKTPTEFDRFAPVSSVKVDSELALSLPSTLDDSPVARSASAVSAQDPTQPGSLTHPEGSIIPYCGNVVSSQQITNVHVSLASYVLSLCESWIAEADITIFLEILGRRIDYYVVVHEPKTIAWVVGHIPESFKNATRTKHELEYWIHMENFPGPRFSTPDDLRSLRHVLASNAIDGLTSEGSTSPMSVQQIQTHLKLLDSFSTDGDINQTYSIARLWNLILQSRIINKYGTPEARLDRFISISDNPPTFAGTYASTAKFMFNIPQVHLKRCSRAWADRIAYTEEWHKFRETNEQEWKQVMNLACVLVIASLLVAKQSSGFFGILSHIALLTALGSAASAYYLFNESQNLGDHAADASIYFQAREEILFGVQRIAIMNAAPQALLTWAFLLFVLSIFRL